MRFHPPSTPATSPTSGGSSPRTSPGHRDPPGCIAVELLLGVDPNAGGLVEGRRPVPVAVARRWRRRWARAGRARPGCFRSCSSSRSSACSRSSNDPGRRCARNGCRGRRHPDTRFEAGQVPARLPARPGRAGRPAPGHGRERRGRGGTDAGGGGSNAREVRSWAGVPRADGPRRSRARSIWPPPWAWAGPVRPASAGSSWPMPIFRWPRPWLRWPSTAACPVAVAVPCHRDDGTPVLSLPTAVAGFVFAYGPGSFRRHAAAARGLRAGLPGTARRPAGPGRRRPGGSGRPVPPPRRCRPAPGPARGMTPSAPRDEGPVASYLAPAPTGSVGVDLPVPGPAPWPSAPTPTTSSSAAAPRWPSGRRPAAPSTSSCSPTGRRASWDPTGRPARARRRPPGGAAGGGRAPSAARRRRVPRPRRRRAGSGLRRAGRGGLVIRQVQPDVVLGHDPWKRYRLHPDHRHAGFLAVRRHRGRPRPALLPGAERGPPPARPRSCCGRPTSPTTSRTIDGAIEPSWRRSSPTAASG